MESGERKEEKGKWKEENGELGIRNCGRRPCGVKLRRSIIGELLELADAEPRSGKFFLVFLVLIEII